MMQPDHSMRAAWRAVTDLDDGRVFSVQGAALKDEVGQERALRPANV